MAGETGSRDLHDAMWLLVHEEAPLSEVPLGVTAVLPDGPVVHGPWVPAECAAVLLRWFDRGWVRLSASGEELDAAVARGVLADPSAWVPARREGLLCVSARPAAPPPERRDAWLAAADDPAADSAPGPGAGPQR